MSQFETFFDTNIVLYLLSGNAVKADRTEDLLAQAGVISVQVLNEFCAVASRKLAMSWPEIREFLRQLREVCFVVPVTVETHERGLRVAERYSYSLHDSMIIAAALLAGCKKLYTEDLQHGQLIDHELTIINPYQ